MKRTRHLMCSSWSDPVRTSHGIPDVEGFELEVHPPVKKIIVVKR